MRLDTIVRAYPANRLAFGEKVGIYLSRWWEFLTDEPRDEGAAGGVFPALFGTVIMTLLMLLAVMPCGVLAAIYLREYAGARLTVSAVRIAVSNLAGMPGIVFGVFGLGFFCYGMGAFIDGGPSRTIPEPAWFALLGAAAVVGMASFVVYLRSASRTFIPATPARKILRYGAGLMWMACTAGLLVLVAVTPFFEGFFRGRLPEPTFGKGALIWASLTLALMSLPVVITATEEALSAVPNSMREASSACGATRWQTIRRIVLPRAWPGILTGMILAVARGASVVAPLILVGAVGLASELPFEWGPPFGLDRSFMHLGHHIYDVSLRTEGDEAARPAAFAATLVLIVLVGALNLAAVAVRSRMRRNSVADRF
jgi:ABC-type phosphate transport system permease subunit